MFDKGNRLETLLLLAIMAIGMFAAWYWYEEKNLKAIYWTVGLVGITCWVIGAGLRSKR
jgi:hypothetical protein